MCFRGLALCYQLGSGFSVVAMVGNRESLEKQLQRAEFLLRELEQQRAGYTPLTVPATLILEWEEQREVVAELRRRLGLPLLESEETPESEPVRVPNNLPFDNRGAFVGREEDLERLHRLLQGEGQVAICTGMGGVGKTELALQYARRHLEDYAGGVCWLFVRGREAGQQIVEFARGRFDGLELPEQVPVLELVRKCYQQWPAGEVLLVLDDVVDWRAVREFLPTEERFKVLLTSRERLLRAEQRLDLEVLSPEAALELLTAIAGAARVQAEVAAAAALCAWLGYLPLGVELAGWYLADVEDLPVGAYLQRLQQRGLGSRSLQEVPETVRAEYGVAEAFELSWERLSAGAQRLGVMLSIFGQAPIPWEIVARALGEAADPEDVEQWRDRELVRGHLLERVGPEVVRLHPLVREFLQQKGEEMEGLAALQRSVAMAIVIEAERIEQTMTRQAVAAVAPAVPHITELAEQGVEWLTEEDLPEPFERLGMYYFGLLDYDRAQHWHEQCSALAETRFGQDHIGYSTGLSNLAELHLYLERYTEALPLLQEALEHMRRNLPDDHPYIAVQLNNLAQWYQRQESYDEALPFAEEALEHMRRTLPDDHPNIANSLRNLAILYRGLGDYEEAVPLAEEALERDRQFLPDDHPDIAISLTVLGDLYQAQGQHDEALPLCLEALERDRRTLPEDHPGIAIDLNNLACLRRDMGDLVAALSLFEEALAILQRSLPPEHSQVAKTRRHLADLRRRLGDPLP